MNPQHSTIDPFLVALCALGLIAGILVIARASSHRLEAELEETRIARAKLENDLDGALGTIHELRKPDGSESG